MEAAPKKTSAEAGPTGVGLQSRAFITGHTQPSLARRKGSTYVLNGHKWWASGAPDPRCEVCIFMGKTDPAATPYKQQSMVLVPMDAAGVTIVRPLPVFGYDDAPHGHAEMTFQVCARINAQLHGLAHLDAVQMNTIAMA